MTLPAQAAIRCSYRLSNVCTFFLSQHDPPLLNNLSVCRLLNCIIDNLTTCIGILLLKTEHLLVMLEQNASVTAREDSIYGIVRFL